MTNKKILIIFLVLLTIISIFWLIWEDHLLEIWKDYLLKKGDVLITTDKTQYQIGKYFELTIENKFNKTICFSPCNFYYLEKKDGEWRPYPREPYLYESCFKNTLINDCIGPQEKQTKISGIYLPEVQIGNHRLTELICFDCKIGQRVKEVKRFYSFYSNEFLIEPKETITPPVAIATDKTEYRRGEMVKITITNNGEKEIFRTYNPYGGLNLQKYENGQWDTVNEDIFHPRMCSCGDSHCYVKPGFNTPLSPGDKIEVEWNQIIDWCGENLNKKEEKAATGKYRFAFLFKDIIREKIYSNELIIQEEQIDETLAWKIYWKTYRNDTYGFEFKYPSEFSVSEAGEGSAGSISFWGGWIILGREINDIPPEECLEPEFLTKTDQKKNINGVDFYYYINYPVHLGDYCAMSGGCDYRDIYRSFYKNHCYELKFSRLSKRVDNVFNEEALKIFNQIISTFKLLD